MMSVTTGSPADMDASFVIVGQSQVLDRTVAEPTLLSTPVPPSVVPTPVTQPILDPQVKSITHPSLGVDYVPGAHGAYAHDWSPRATGGDIRIHGRHFVDAFGRVCQLRGVNAGGSSKAPTNHQDERFPEGHREVTFVGRPFPLEEAPEHFARLRRWGMTFIRFLVTWEAVEHEGPGIYDHSYLKYIRSLLSLLPDYGLIAFVSLHQDVWSRYSGGSGAPAWTLEACGFDLNALEETGAAWLLGVKGGGHIEAERGIWPCGYQKLAAATMATLFWAGDTFAPKLKIKTSFGDNVPVQQFLQNSMLDMWEQVVKSVGDLPGVLGFEMMNEPHRGYIEQRSLHEFVYETDLHLSFVPSAFQSFLLGAGHPTEVGHWTRSFPLPTRQTSRATLNTAGVKCWTDHGPTEGKCVWEMHGVWGWDTRKEVGVVLREGYFRKHPMTGREVDWYKDFYYPFVNKWAERVRDTVGQEKIVFLEPIPNEFCPSSWANNRPANMVFAPHWYDLRALFEKAFGDFSVNVQGLSRGMFPLQAFYWGQRGVRNNYSLQIQNIVEAGYKSLGEVPVVIGECGIPMDMNKKEALKNGDWKWQARMMDALLVALERSLVGFTLWNYNPDNSDATGDDWNGENFSWFSRSRTLPSNGMSLEQTSPSLDYGARIIRSVVRPYAAKVAGIPLEFEYESTTGAFSFTWAEPSASGEGSPSVIDPPRAHHPHLRARETEIYIPSILSLHRKLRISGLGSGDKWTHDEDRQTLFIVADPRLEVHRLQVYLDPPLDSDGHFVVNDFWGDFGGWVVGVLVGLLMITTYLII